MGIQGVLPSQQQQQHKHLFTSFSFSQRYTNNALLQDIAWISQSESTLID